MKASTIDSQIAQLRRALESADEEAVTSICIQLEMNAVALEQADVDALTAKLIELAHVPSVYLSPDFYTLVLSLEGILRDSSSSREIRENSARSIFSLFEKLPDGATANLTVAEFAAEFLPAEELANLYENALQKSTEGQRYAIADGIEWAACVSDRLSDTSTAPLKRILERLIKESRGGLRRYAQRRLLRFSNPRPHANNDLSAGDVLEGSYLSECAPRGNLQPWLDRQIEKLRRALACEDEDAIIDISLRFQIDVRHMNQAHADALAVALTRVATEQSLHSSPFYGWVITTVKEVLRSASSEIREECARTVFSLFKQLPEDTWQSDVAEVIGELLPPKEAACVFVQTLEASTVRQKLSIIDAMAWTVMINHRNRSASVASFKPILDTLIQDSSERIRKRVQHVMNEWSEFTQ